MDGALTTCDSCDHRFEPSPHERPDPDGVVIEFHCPRCSAAYPVSHVTERGLRLRERIKDLRRRGEVDEALNDAYRVEVTKLT